MPEIVDAHVAAAMECDEVDMMAGAAQGGHRQLHRDRSPALDEEGLRGEEEDAHAAPRLTPGPRYRRASAASGCPGTEWAFPSFRIGGPRAADRAAPP